MLTIVEEVHKDKRIMYKVRCECGREEIKRKDHVLKGRVTLCKRCASKVTASKYPPPVRRTGHEGLSGTHYLSIKFGASRRSIPFDLSAQFLWELYLKQDRLCAITNLPIILVNATSKSNPDWKVITASLDRIDNTKGYTKDNVWWVHKTMNQLKNNMSMSDLLYWSKLIVDKHGNPEPSKSGDTFEGATTRDRVSEETVIIPKSARPRYEDSYTGSNAIARFLLSDDIV